MERGKFVSEISKIFRKGLIAVGLLGLAINSGCGTLNERRLNVLANNNLVPESVSSENLTNAILSGCVIEAGNYEGNDIESESRGNGVIVNIDEENIDILTAQHVAPVKPVNDEDINDPITTLSVRCGDGAFAAKDLEINTNSQDSAWVIQGPNGEETEDTLSLLRVKKLGNNLLKSANLSGSETTPNGTKLVGFGINFDKSYTKNAGQKPVTVSYVVENNDANVKTINTKTYSNGRSVDFRHSMNGAWICSGLSNDGMSGMAVYDEEMLTLRGILTAGNEKKDKNNVILVPVTVKDVRRLIEQMDQKMSELNK